MQEGKSYLPDDEPFPTPDGMRGVRELIKTRAAQLGRSLAELSRAVGMNHAYLQQFISRRIPKKLPEDIRDKLARELRLSPELLKENPSTSDLAKGSARRNVQHRLIAGQGVADDVFVSLPSQVGEVDLPVYRARGGEAAIILDPEPIDYVVRPESLMRVRDAYGVQVVGTSMVPELRPGWVVHVNPNLVALPGDTCVFRGASEDGTYRACIKELVKEQGDTWQVRQHSPAPGEPEIYQIPKSEYPEAHVTVGVDKRRR